MTSTALAAESGPHFLQQAEIGGQYEISSSRLALQISRNPAIKAYARQMIEDHTKIANEMTNLVPRPIWLRGSRRRCSIEEA